MITQLELKAILEYEPDTGEWTWLISPRANVPVGQLAGSYNSEGYKRIKIDGVVYPATQLAVLYMTGRWPKDEVDHKNRIPGDDRWINLREATHSENMRNRAPRKDNKSGVAGISWRESRQKWVVKCDGVYIGQFNALEDAVKVRKEFVEKFHGEFAYGSKQIEGA